MAVASCWLAQNNNTDWKVNCYAIFAIHESSSREKQLSAVDVATGAITLLRATSAQRQLRKPRQQLVATQVRRRWRREIQQQKAEQSGDVTASCAANHATPGRVIDVGWVGHLSVIGRPDCQYGSCPQSTTLKSTPERTDRQPSCATLTFPVIIKRNVEVRNSFKSFKWCEVFQIFSHWSWTHVHILYTLPNTTVGHLLILTTYRVFSWICHVYCFSLSFVQLHTCIKLALFGAVRGASMYTKY